MNRIRMSIMLMLFLLNLNACSNKNHEVAEEVIRTVRTVNVSLQNEVASREFSGVVDAYRKVDLAFRVGGSIQTLPVLQGDFVKKNQLVAQLDQTNFEIQLKAQQAELDRAKAEFERARTLVERQLIARSDFDKLKAQYFVAQTQLEKAQQDLSGTTIKAPFEGYISNRHVENFSEVQARTPVLTLMDLDSLVITIEVPESIMINVQRSNFRPELYATFKGHEASQFPLTIKEIGARANTSSQTYPVTLSLPPIPTLNILPGMSAVVGVRPFAKHHGSTSVVYLPPQVVLEDSAGRYVYIAVPQSDGNALIERRNVSVGDMSSFGIEILQGLDPGDSVVTTGMSQIVPAMQVKLLANQ